MNEETLFHLACEKPPDGRAAFLDEACAGDTALRQRLEVLLAAHDEPGSFLQSAARDNGNGEVAPDSGRTVLQTGVQEVAGSVIGPYKLLQQIGEGGMGVVFMAEQSRPVRRTVALKIIKPGMDSRQVIARFEAERQALAMMDHPNIARVLDAGTTAPASGYPGRPYFVMELVKGVPITTYCDEHRLTPQDRLELFVHVCHAVQHAHQKGIIHRDLKPSNVLIAQYDGKPVPKVIDFGVAKATGQQLTERTMFTSFGNVIGTPEYMSPEQAELNQLDIDTRSDVYSLGVLLYELLTGTTPIEHKRVKEAALLEVLRVIREEEPPKPSTRLSTIAELPSIAAQRGLEPKKLSGLVKGELDWIVMKALEKDRSRRYETANGFAGDIERYLHDEPVQACPPSSSYRFRKFARRHRAGLLLASVALIALFVLVIGLVVHNRMIVRERNEKADALKLAQAESQRAEQNFRRVSITISDTVMKAALGVGEFSSLPLPVRKRFAEEMAKFNESLMHQDLRDPDLQYEAAVGHRSMGTLQNTFGDTKKAEQLMRSSVQMLDRLASEHPTVGKYHHQLAWSCLCLARILNATNRADEAKSYFEKSAKLYEARLKEEPKSPTYRNELITCYRALGSEEAILRALAILEHDPSRDAGDGAYTELVAHVHLALAQLRAGQGRVAEAKSDFRAAAHDYQEAFSKRQNAPILFHWALCYYELIALPNKDTKAAMAEGEEAYRAFLDVQSRIPDALKGHRDLRLRAGHVHRVWAFKLIDAGRLDEAEKRLRDALDVLESLSKDQPNDPAIAHLAADTHRRIGQNLVARGRQQEAELEFRQAIAMHGQRAAKFPGSSVDTSEVAAAYAHLAKLLVDKGEIMEAEQMYSNAIERTPQTWYSWYCRARFYQRQHESEKAQADLTHAAKLATDPISQNEMAWALASDPDPSWRNPKLAAELAERAIAARPADGMIWNSVGTARYRNGQWKEGVAAFDKSMELRNGGDVNDWFFVAMCHWQLGEKDEARKWYHKAVEWTEKYQPKNTQFRHFRTEAEELMKIPGKEPSTKVESKQSEEKAAGEALIVNQLAHRRRISPALHLPDRASLFQKRADSGIFSLPVVLSAVRSRLSL